MGTQFSVDSNYAKQTSISYSFSAQAGHDGPYVVLDDTLAPVAGTILMDHDHVLRAVADTIYTLDGLSPDGREIANRVSVLLTGADKQSAYRDLMLYLMTRLQAGADGASLAREYDLAWYLSTSLTDSAALRAVDDALNGTVFSIALDGGSPSITFRTLAPASIITPSRSPQPASGARMSLSPPLHRTQMVIPADQLNNPQEATVFVYVNGIATDEAETEPREGAVVTNALLAELLSTQARFSNRMTRVDYVYNRRESVQMADYDATHRCAADAQRNLPVLGYLQNGIGYAACKAQRYLVSLTTNDLVEAVTARLQLLLRLPNTNPDVDRITSYVNERRSVYHEHVIIVAHSEGTLLSALATRELPSVEGHPIQFAPSCVSLLGLANAADRGSVNLDDPYKLGFTIQDDIILSTFATGWDIVHTPATDAAAAEVAKASKGGTDNAAALYERLRQSVKLHSINDTYLTDRVSRDAIVARATTLHRECLQGELTLSPSVLTAAVGTQFTITPKLINQNGRELFGRTMIESPDNEIGLVAEHTYLALTPREPSHMPQVVVMTQLLGEVASVNIPLDGMIGTTLVARDAKQWVGIGANNGGLENAPILPPPTDPGACGDTFVVYGPSGWSGPSSTTYQTVCDRQYTITAGHPSTPSVAAQAIGYRVWLQPGGTPIGMASAPSIQRDCGQAADCVDSVIAEAIDQDGLIIARSGAIGQSVPPAASPSVSVSLRQSTVVMNGSGAPRSFP